MARDYSKDTIYEESPKQVKNREQRNRARRELEKSGKVSKGDGMDVDHIHPLSRGGSGKASNLRAIPEGRNRGWRKGESNYYAKKV